MDFTAVISTELSFVPLLLINIQNISIDRLIWVGVRCLFLARTTFAGATLRGLGEDLFLPFADGITLGDLHEVLFLLEIGLFDGNLNNLVTLGDVRNLLDVLDLLGAGNLLVVTDLLTLEGNPFAAAALAGTILLVVAVLAEVDPATNASAISIINTLDTLLIANGDLLDGDLNSLGDGAVLHNGAATLLGVSNLNFTADESLLLLNPFATTSLGGEDFGLAGDGFGFRAFITLTVRFLVGVAWHVFLKGLKKIKIFLFYLSIYTTDIHHR